MYEDDAILRDHEAAFQHQAESLQQHAADIQQLQNRIATLEQQAADAKLMDDLERKARLTLRGRWRNFTRDERNQRDARLRTALIVLKSQNYNLSLLIRSSSDVQCFVLAYETVSVIQRQGAHDRVVQTSILWCSRLKIIMS